MAVHPKKGKSIWNTIVMLIALAVAQIKWNVYLFYYVLQMIFCWHWQCVLYLVHNGITGCRQSQTKHYLCKLACYSMCTRINFIDYNFSFVYWNKISLYSYTEGLGMSHIHIDAVSVQTKNELQSAMGKGFKEKMISNRNLTMQTVPRSLILYKVVFGSSILVKLL